MAKVTFDLFESGMDYITRQGLGVLASLVRIMTEEETVSEDEMYFDDTTLTINGDLEELVATVYNYGFVLNDGLIHNSSVYPPDKDPPISVRAYLHEAFRTNLFQCRREALLMAKETTSKKGDDEEKTTGITKCGTEEFEGKKVVYKYGVAKSYKRYHESRVDTLFKKRKFVEKADLVYYDMPTVMNRHNSGLAKGKLKINGKHLFLADLSRLGVVPNTFCVSDPAKKSKVYKSTAVYFDVTNLNAYVEQRPLLTPTDLRSCFVTGLDSSLDAWRMITEKKVRAFQSAVIITFKKHKWNEKQFSPESIKRVNFLDIDTEKIKLLNAVSSIFIPPVIPLKAKTSDDGDHFIVSCPIRPLIENNIIEGRPWYTDFTIDQFKLNSHKVSKMIQTCESGSALNYINAVRRSIYNFDKGLTCQNKQEVFSKQYGKWLLACRQIRSMSDVQCLIADIASKTPIKNSFGYHIEDVIAITGKLRSSNDEIEHARYLTMMGITTYYQNQEEAISDV